MAGWGLMMGLGQGLQDFGGVLSANNKQKMADKLEAEKLTAKNAREDKLHQQALLEPDPQNTSFEMRDGVLYQVTPNKSGGVFEAKLAPQNKIDEYNYNKKKEDVSLEAATLGLTKAKNDIKNYDADRSLQNRYVESQIQRNNDTGLAATMNADTRATTASASTTKGFEDAADDLVKDTSDMQKQYTTAPSGTEPLMTASEYRMVVRDAVKAAAQRGIDPRSFLSQQLEIYVRDKRSPAGKRAIP